MKDTQYVRFTEENDHEGETWNFYIPVEGNEEAIEKLRELLEPAEFYDLSEETFPEFEIDILVKHTAEDNGYNPAHNLLGGKLDLSGCEANLDEESDDFDDPFYKGGICGFMKPW